MLSIGKMQPQYFLSFFQILLPSVETYIQKQFIHQLPLQERIYEVLDEVSWNEWQNKPLKFVQPLSKILITLLYDKIQLSLKKLENTPELNSFLEKISLLIQSPLEDSSNLEEARNQFVGYLENLWRLANKSEPKTPILDYEGFPLNKLLIFMFKDWDSCLEIINLICKIRGDIKSGNQLLLPYIFEIGIPEYQKQLQGQIFTPLPVVDFICKQNLTEKTTRIIDPACGTGIFLLGALRVLIESRTIQYNQIELIGVELDPVLADIAESAINYFLLINPNSMADWRIYRYDFFNCDSSTLELLMKNSGMTTLLMNPPYTRHEILTTEYKEFLKEKILLDLQKIETTPSYSRTSLSGRSGLYVYFLVHATSLLDEEDNVGLIIPNSWLDVVYGQQLQQFILDHYLIEFIINSRIQKVIPTADVNTAILKLKRKKMEAYQEVTNSENLVNFVSINNILDLELLVDKKISHLKDYSSRIQVVSVKQKELFSKSKWGIYFRAPIDYFKLIKKLDEKLIILGEVAHVRRGFTSGANDFFYVGKPGKSNAFFTSSWDSDTGDLMLYLKDELVIKQFKAQGFHPSEPMFIIEKDYWMHRDIGQEKYSWEYSFKDNDGSTWVPNYLVKSPRSLTNYEIHEKDLNFVVILIASPSPINRLKTGIRKYIRWGEKWIPSVGNKFNQRPTCSSRKNWYSLPSHEYESFNLLCLMTINDRFPFFYNPQDFYFDARLYGIQFINTKFKQGDLLFTSYFLYLNSIFTTLQLELLGRSNLGEGGLDIKVYEYELLKIPNYDLLVKTYSKDIFHAFSQLLDYSPFSVLQGTPKSIKQITNDYVARLFSLSQALVNNLYNDLKNLVQMRIQKAK